MEKEIKIAAKLYQCRDTAKRFFKEEYKEKLKPYTRVLEAMKKIINSDTLPALLECLKLKLIDDNGMGQMMFMAAAVEMIEPSKDMENENTD